MQQLKFDYVKVHPAAVVPEKTAGNLGFDLSVVRDVDFYRRRGTLPDEVDHRYLLKPGQRRLFHTGLKMAIQEGYGVILWDRSGMSAKHGVQKCAGCFDSTYRGEWLVCLHNTDKRSYSIVEGDRIIQAIVVPEFMIDFEEHQELDETLRGETGFGASGR